MSGERSAGERQRSLKDTEHPGGGHGGGRGCHASRDAAPTRHLCFGPLVVDGLAGQGVDPDLGHRHRGVFQLAVEPQHLGSLTGVLHYLHPGQETRRISAQFKSELKT